MKTLEQIKSYMSKTFDGRDLTRLADFIPESDLPSWLPNPIGDDVGNEFKYSAEADGY